MYTWGKEQLRGSMINQMYRNVNDEKCRYRLFSFFLVYYLPLFHRFVTFAGKNTFEKTDFLFWVFLISYPSDCG